jgi:hypothetical protein
MTSASVKSIMSKRVLIPAEASNKRATFTIQGDGNVIDVKDKDGELVTSTIAGYEGTVLQKKIFNLQANSAVAMANPRTRQYLIDALKAEKAGDTAKADELFNSYLNGAQMSFGVLLPSAVVDQLRKGVEIAARVITVTTENGSLLTIDPSTITIMEPERYGATSFNLEDFAKEAASETKKDKKKDKAGTKA